MKCKIIFSKAGFGFDNSVSDARSLTILSKNYFTFEEFEERDGLWPRVPKIQKILLLIVGILNPLVCICMIPCMACCAKMQDKV